jgi:hypothetical protein
LRDLVAFEASLFFSRSSAFFLFFNSPPLGLPRLARAAACRLVDEEEMVGDGVRFAATRTHKAC